MPGPTPQPNRQARPGRDLAWTDLPRAGRSDVPKLPSGHGLRAAGRRRWDGSWSTPSATQWDEVETGPQVLRLCQLEDVWQRDRDLKVLPEMRQLETALGLTPKARKELRWRIVEDGAVVEENGERLAEPRRLRVVDDQAV